MNELSLFTGIGGGIYGSLILGWKTKGYVERDEYCRSVLQQRINDKWFDDSPIYGDIVDFNKGEVNKYENRIDVITGGFPCQPFSVAGKRKGTSDERYLFDEIIKTIKVVQPRWLFFENVPGLLDSNAIIEIYETLNKIGYECKPPLLLGSSDCGNIHRRQRVWIFAESSSKRQRGWTSEECDDEWVKCQSFKSERSTIWGEIKGCTVQSTDPDSIKLNGNIEETIPKQSTLQRIEYIRTLEDLRGRPDIPEPLFRRVANELPDWRKQLKAIGNGQDPIVMATAWNILYEY